MISPEVSCHDKEKKAMAKIHLTLNERLRLEFLLNDGRNFAEIGRELGKDRSTISREVRNHTVESRKAGYGRRHNDCKNRYHCPASENCGKTCNRMTCSGCNKGCGPRICCHFERDVCDKLMRVPYVCNGCNNFNRCTLTKILYDGAAAEKKYEKDLKESREGFAITREDAVRIQKDIKPLIDKGQSVYAVMENSPTEIPFTAKTMYTYIDAGVFPEIRNIDLPRKVKYKGRKKKRDLAYKTDRKCREGRKKEDFDAFMAENPGTPVTEMDTVEGPKAERRCILTLQFISSSLQLGFLREANDSASVSGIFRELRKKLGKEDYKKLFQVVLTDNGSEFTDPEAIEFDDDGEMLARVFFCHPLASWEKGDCENNHALIRRIIPKGRSLTSMTQQKVDLMMNHINSYPRAQYSGKSAYDMFVFLHGQELAEKLGLERIPGTMVTLKPELV